MSEESGEPKPSKLKLSSSRNQPNKQQSAPQPSASDNVNISLAPKSAPTTSEPDNVKISLAPKSASTASAPADVNASLPPKLEATTPQAPVASKPPTTLKTTPPPLTKKAAPRTSSNPTKKAEAPVKQAPASPEKSSPLGSVLIVVAILFILAAAAGGIWFLLRSDQSEATADTDVPSLEASPSNPIERAKATIATVPDRNLDKVLALESTPEPDSEALVEPAGLAAAEPTAPISPDLKEAVSEYLQNLHIGGVRTGARARIMLDGENYNIGDTVDASTGLIFIGTRDKKLLFKDPSGTTYVKSF